MPDLNLKYGRMSHFCKSIDDLHGNSGYHSSFQLKYLDFNQNLESMESTRFAGHRDPVWTLGLLGLL